MEKDFIITGIPRSGTTLTTALANCLEDVVCLSEPREIGRIFNENLPKEQKLANFADYFEKVYIDIESGLPVENKVSIHTGNRPLTNYYTDKRSNSKRNTQYTYEAEIFNVSEGFMLGLKENSYFISFLKELSERYRVICVIRNPVNTILSWQSLNIPASRAEVPFGLRKYWPELKFNKDASLLDRQVELYKAYLDRIINNREKIVLYRYEDLIENVSMLEGIFERNFDKALPEIRKLPERSTDKHAEEVKKYVVKKIPFIKDFYDL